MISHTALAIQDQALGILCRLERGVDAAAIAAEFRISVAGLEAILRDARAAGPLRLKDFGHAGGDGSARLTRDERDRQIRKAVAGGLSIAETAATIGLGEQTTRQYARRMGLRFRDDPTPIVHRRPANQRGLSTCPMASRRDGE